MKVKLKREDKKQNSTTISINYIDSIYMQMKR